MTTVRLCKACGAPLPADAPEGLCPKCLVAAGLMSELSTLPRQTVLVTPSQVLGDAAAKPSTAPAEASQPFGGYRIIRPLGKGGMGAVYEAEEIESGRRVALKVLSHTPESPEARQRFLREGRLAASVNHPNTVYVFGTEEIDGTPVITMELVAGGTLKDQVQRDGPLPASKAVDTMLQVIAGLEAAATLGVLHRDVKPSNCFVDADGTVKVGDFGLSISTLSRGQTNLTLSGAFLGTPAYASPEQLRGEELDVRSDIYAVGATLYFLLTSKTPFAPVDIVHLVAAVLEKEPERPRTVQSGIPKGLEKVVLRCLKKPKADRFVDYRQLRQALEPYSSAAPATIPAMGLRFLAGAIDVGVLFGLTTVVAYFWSRHFAAAGRGSVSFSALPVSMVVFMAGYFALSEGVWGHSLGKMLCRLRVVGRDGALPAFGATLVRALIFVGVAYASLVLVVLLCLPSLGQRLQGTVSRLPGEPLFFLSLLVAGVGAMLRRLRVECGDGPLLAFGATLGRALIFAGMACFGVWIMTTLSRSVLEAPLQDQGAPLPDALFLLLLFAGATKANRFAGLHDRVSRTRVIQARASAARRGEPANIAASVVSESAARFGPYRVLSSLGGTESGEWLLGYDFQLLRSVWMRKLPDSTPPLDLRSRTISRPGRLRWLNGKRAPGNCWDAYEAPAGESFLAKLRHPQPWAVVRHWLLDLIQELQTARKDGTTPVMMGLDTIWITADGHLKLLDFAAPGTQAEIPSLRVDTSALQAGPGTAWLGATNAVVFLRQVALSALEGRPMTSAEAEGDEVRVPLPLHARRFLDTLRPGTSNDLPEKALKALLSQCPGVTPMMRFGLIAACWALPVFGLVMEVDQAVAEKQTRRTYHEFIQLRRCVNRLEQLRLETRSPAVDEERHALEIYVKSLYRPGPRMANLGTNQADGSMYVRDSYELFLAIPNLFRGEWPTKLGTNRVETAEQQTWLQVFKGLNNRYPSAQEVVAAKEKLKAFLEREGAPTQRSLRQPIRLVVREAFGLAEAAVFFVALPGLIAVLIARGGLLLKVLRVAVVGWDGLPAPRWRVAVRFLVGWAPVLLAGALFHFSGHDFTKMPVAVAISCGIMLAIAVVGAVYAILHPDRGPQDIIAGTWLVPR